MATEYRTSALPAGAGEVAGGGRSAASAATSPGTGSGAGGSGTSRSGQSTPRSGIGSSGAEGSRSPRPGGSADGARAGAANTIVTAAAQPRRAASREDPVRRSPASDRNLVLPRHFIRP